MKNPKIIKIGNNPNCHHNEFIEGNIGKCRKCGQVRDYSECNFEDARNEHDLKVGHTYATFHIH